MLAPYVAAQLSSSDENKGKEVRGKNAIREHVW